MRIISVLLSAALLPVLFPAFCSAEILPQNLAIIANSASRESMEIARHYAVSRNVPPEHIIPLALPIGETIQRQEFEKLLLEPLRKELTKRKLAQSVRVLVTTFDVPLRVAAPEAQGADKQKSLDALTKRQLARNALAGLAIEASRLLAEKPIDPPSAEISDEDLLKLVDAEFKGAADRVSELDDDQTKRASMNHLGGLIEKVGGMAGVLNTIKPSGDESKQRVEGVVAGLQQQVQLAEAVLRALGELPTDSNRQRAYDVTARIYGIVGVLQRANFEVQSLKYEQADASVDSELTLLWWEREMFPIQGRLPSPLYYANRQNLQGPRIPMLMVSRLDGPTAEVAKQLVDLALVGERKGLEGKVYVDARGMSVKDPETFFTYDQDLRDFGWLVREETDYSVNIENHEELLEEAEEAAVYVGWYSVHKFAGKFTFPPGAIGYHIASSEALSIRNPQEPGWCKNLLERGIAVTLGAVDEPYLDSFPRPTEFFTLLMTGKYNLAEAYFLTASYTSWRLALFGDPLYNPWKSRPALDAENVKLKDPRWTPAETGSLPPPPGDDSFPDPVEMRAQIAKQRKDAQQKIDDFFERAAKQAPKVATPPTPKVKS